MSIPNNSEDTYGGNSISTSIQKRSNHPSKSYWMENYDENKNDEAIRLQLDLVDEVWATAEQRLARY